MRRAALVGFAIGTPPGLYLGVQAARAWLIVHYAARASRAIVRLLRDDRLQRELAAGAGADRPYRELIDALR